MEESKKPHKTSKHLKNNDAIRKMLDGTHHTQTRKSISLWNAKTTERHEVGDRWTDANGVEWEQRDGYRVQGIDQLERMQEIQEFLNGEDNCPECEESMTNRLDKKFYGIHKMCMECSIKKETKMKINGTWKAYEQQRVLNNVIAWLKDAEEEKNVVKNELAKTSYVNGDGTMQHWTLPYDVKEKQEEVERQFIQFKHNLLTRYGATEEQLIELGVHNDRQDKKSNA